MKSSALLLAFTYFASLIAGAQDMPSMPNAHPIGRWYDVTTFDMLFSAGDFSSNGVEWKQETRFAPVFNFQVQNHFNGKNVGIYTGIGLRNIGFIHSLPRDTAQKIELRQRAYSLNLPLAIKIGNMAKGVYIAMGAEAHWLFQYKSKLEEGDEKSKYREWFSNRVNPFNLSLFTDLRFRNGTYFRFNFFLADFLSDDPYALRLPASGVNMMITPGGSSLFYFSFGTALKVKKKHPLTLKDV